jgi:hypothetical protein
VDSNAATIKDLKRDLKGHKFVPKKFGVLLQLPAAKGATKWLAESSVRQRHQGFLGPQVKVRYTSTIRRT